jgi:hypothetical protein
MVDPSEPLYDSYRDLIIAMPQCNMKDFRKGLQLNRRGIGHGNNAGGSFNLFCMILHR